VPSRRCLTPRERNPSRARRPCPPPSTAGRGLSFRFWWCPGAARASRPRASSMCIDQRHAYKNWYSDAVNLSSL
jgi:hypothetical protein